MVLSREQGFPNPEYNPGSEKPPERKIKVIKKNGDQLETMPLIKYEDFKEVPKDQLEIEQGKQPIKEWAEDLRAAAKLKEQERATKEDKARKEFEDLFKENKQ